MRSALFFTVGVVFAAQVFGATLFDRVVAKGKGIEVKASEVDETFIAYKSTRAAGGQPVPQTAEETKAIEAKILDSLIAQRLLLARAAGGQPVPQTAEETKAIEAKILDSLIAQRLLLARATEADRATGAVEAAKFIEEKKKQAPSEGAFRRQLIVSGMTMEQFEKE